jgi:hypothetical protein
MEAHGITQDDQFRTANAKFLCGEGKITLPKFRNLPENESWDSIGI